MSSNSTSPVITDISASLSGFSLCDDQTCSTAKCALCLHCSQQYCFVHFLKHNEELSLNAYNFTLAIDQLEEKIKNLKLDETLRRTIYSLDQWRKKLIRTIECVYQEKLSSIKSNYIQLSNLLQQFQFEQSSHIQTLRIDLEQMKFIRSTYDEEMDKIQKAIKQLQTNCSELKYDLYLKEQSAPNIFNSIECELVWKRYHSDSKENPISEELINSNLHPHDEDTSSDIHRLSPQSYEQCLFSLLLNYDERTNSTETRKKDLPRKGTNNNKKKRRTCTNCGKFYHPSSLQRHYRQCKHQTNSSSPKLDGTKLKTVTNIV